MIGPCPNLPADTSPASPFRRRPKQVGKRRRPCGMAEQTHGLGALRPDSYGESTGPDSLMRRRDPLQLVARSAIRAAWQCRTACSELQNSPYGKAIRLMPHCTEQQWVMTHSLGEAPAYRLLTARPLCHVLPKAPAASEAAAVRQEKRSGRRKACCCPTSSSTGSSSAACPPLNSKTNWRGTKARRGLRR